MRPRFLHKFELNDELKIKWKNIRFEYCYDHNGINGNKIYVFFEIKKILSVHFKFQRK